MLLVTVTLGLLIGLALGALGGGGSILTVPALVYVLGEPARAATTGSLIIVGAAAVAGTVAHARTGNVRWGPGIAFGLAGVAASYAGTAAGGRVDPNILLLAFAVLIALVGAAMSARGSRPRDAGRQARTGDPAGGTGLPAPRGEVGGEVPAGTTLVRTVAPAAPPTVVPHVRSLRQRAVHPVAQILLAGLAVGFLTGFFGVGGGFVIVPALVMALGYRMPAAVGTSLLVIAINSAAALTARIGHASFHWSLLVPFAAAALAGSLAGRRVTDAVPAGTLSKAFTVVLFAVAGYVAVRAGLAATA